jgi:hypothetical protein
MIHSHREGCLPCHIIVARDNAPVLGGYDGAAVHARNPKGVALGIASWLGSHPVGRRLVGRHVPGGEGEPDGRWFNPHETQTKRGYNEFIETYCSWLKRDQLSIVCHICMVDGKGIMH